MILLSDFIIATPETRYIEVFARRGLVVDFGGSWNLPRMIGLQKAKELMMTTNEIDGKTMDNLGMLYKLTDKDNLEYELSTLIELLNNQSFISICMACTERKFFKLLAETKSRETRGYLQYLESQCLVKLLARRLAVLRCRPMQVSLVLVDAGCDLADTIKRRLAKLALDDNAARRADAQAALQDIGFQDIANIHEFLDFLFLPTI
jgi:enoyl-CoA hydratase/carnithine racemase